MPNFLVVFLFLWMSGSGFQLTWPRDNEIMKTPTAEVVPATYLHENTNAKSENGWRKIYKIRVRDDGRSSRLFDVDDSSREKLEALTRVQKPEERTFFEEADAPTQKPDITTAADTTPTGPTITTQKPDTTTAADTTPTGPTITTQKPDTTTAADTTPTGPTTTTQKPDTTTAADTTPTGPTTTTQKNPGTTKNPSQTTVAPNKGSTMSLSATLLISIIYLI